MNVFVLDYDPKVAASYHCDKHVIKMCVEYTQLLSTSTCLVLSKSPEELSVYKPTHVNHPCAVWARKSLRNFAWLHECLGHLLDEYTFRYGKLHKSGLVYDRFVGLGMLDAETWGTATSGTSFVKCVSEHCKAVKGVKEAYRHFYLTDKRHFLSWKNPSSQPFWVD